MPFIYFLNPLSFSLSFSLSPSPSPSPSLLLPLLLPLSFSLSLFPLSLSHIFGITCFPTPQTLDAHKNTQRKFTTKPVTMCCANTHVNIVLVLFCNRCSCEVCAQTMTNKTQTCHYCTNLYWRCSKQYIWEKQGLIL